MEKGKNQKKPRSKIILIVMVVILVILFIGIWSNQRNLSKKEIELTQFKASHPDIQMMGYKIKTANGKVILIDGGTQKEADYVKEQIEEEGGKVDYWFITHPHYDHAGAFVDIVQNTNIPIEHIYISLNEEAWYAKNEAHRFPFTKQVLELIKNSRITDKVIEPRVNEIIAIDSLEVEILGIKNPELTENAGNEQSMVFTIHTGKNKILFLGDTGTKSSEKLLTYQRGKLKSDIVQMAHHGQNGATKELYQVVAPRICLWPTQEWMWNNDTSRNTSDTPWTIEETKQWVDELGVEENYIEKEEVTLSIR